MRYQTVFELVRWAIALVLEMDPSSEETKNKILPSSTLEELNLDSLDLTELATLIEEELSREDALLILVEDAENLTTVQAVELYLYDLGVRDEDVREIANKFPRP